MNNRQRILLVDDNPENLELLGARLRALGYQTTMAFDGAQALESVRRELPDLVVLDVMMPELNGFQVCRALREISPGLPVIMLTSKSEPADRYWATQCGANAFLRKPVDPVVVVRQVADLLELK